MTLESIFEIKIDLLTVNIISFMIHTIYTMLIHEVCINNDINGLSKLLKKNHDINVLDYLWNTGLIWACIYDNIKIVSKLIEEKCDLNIQNKVGAVALIYACETGNRDLILMLIKAKCKLNIKDGEGMTVLM